jgi:toluene monooxygenase system ferredoxin subunit
MVAVEVEGEPVLLVHCHGGHLGAYQGICPHQETPLVDGDLEGTVITCSAHLWQFDALTGAGVNPSDASLYRYDVKVDDEVIYVGVPRDEGRRYLRFGA